MTGKKYKVVFPFVEAGLGHIMPMRAVADAFEKKYGDRAEIVRTDFFRDPKDERLAKVERELIREVKLHNKSRWRGRAQFALMRLFGTRFCMKYLMEHRYGYGFGLAVQYIRDLNADLIFSTHFSTLYYACEARSRGLTNAKSVVYCPDPVLGRQWDGRADLAALTGASGRKKALRAGWKAERLAEVPFLLRDEVAGMTEGRAFYRRKLGLPEDRFTVLLADGAYGAGRLEKTVAALLKSGVPMTIAAVCGKNEALYRRFLQIKPPPHITFVPYGFTDKTLLLAAACDLFAGKSGASNLAEPTYFGAPCIVTLRATPIERWIADRYVNELGCAVLCESARRAAALIERWAADPGLMRPYELAAKAGHRADGAELLADRLWDALESAAPALGRTPSRSLFRLFRRA